MIRIRSNISLEAGVSASREPGRWILPLLAATAALFGTLLYLHTLSNPFIYDDYHLVVENPYLADLTDLRNLMLRDITRPVVTASYILDTAIWGREPYGYRLTNILLHAINVMLVFQLALRVSTDRRRDRNQGLDRAASPALAAFVAACLFAIHPMMTQAVTYISGRSEVAYCGMFMLAFLAGRRWMLSGGRHWLLVCSTLWAIGLLTKESAAMLPFVLMAYGWLVLGTTSPEQRKRLYSLGLPLVALTTIAVVGRIAVLTLVEGASSGIDGRYGLVAVDAFWRYVALFALRREQAVFHSMPMPDSSAPFATVFGVVGFVALPLAAWALRRVHSGMAFGAIWFLLLLVPSGVLFALGVGEPLAEHRAYVAAAGLFIVWGCAFDLLWQSLASKPARAVAAAVGVLFLGQLALRTLERNAIWADPIEIAREAVALAPDHWFPRLLLGDSYRHAGRCEDAIPEYRRVIAVRPQDRKAGLNLAVCFIRLHRLEDAENAMLELEKNQPQSQDAVMTLGVLAALRKDPGRAQSYFQKAMDLHPQLVDAQRMHSFVSGTLPPVQHRELCNELRSISESFDVFECLNWQERTNPSPASPPLATPPN